MSIKGYVYKEKQDDSVFHGLSQNAKALDVPVIHGLQAYRGVQGFGEWKLSRPTWCAGRAEMAEAKGELFVLLSQ